MGVHRKDPFRERAEASTRAELSQVSEHRSVVIPSGMGGAADLHVRVLLPVRFFPESARILQPFAIRDQAYTIPQ